MNICTMKIYTTLVYMYNNEIKYLLLDRIYRQVYLFMLGYRNFNHRKKTYILIMYD